VLRRDLVHPSLDLDGDAIDHVWRARPRAQPVEAVAAVLLEAGRWHAVGGAVRLTAAEIKVSAR
jgi:hypothetical protein